MGVIVLRSRTSAPAPHARVLRSADRVRGKRIYNKLQWVFTLYSHYIHYRWASANRYYSSLSSSPLYIFRSRGQRWSRTRSPLKNILTQARCLAKRSVYPELKAPSAPLMPVHPKLAWNISAWRWFTFSRPWQLIAQPPPWMEIAPAMLLRS